MLRDYFMLLDESINSYMKNNGYSFDCLVGEQYMGFKLMTDRPKNYVETSTAST